MRGPIDYIIVGFEGNKFDGSILKAIGDAIDSGVIALIDLAAVSRDDSDNVTALSISDLGDEYALEFMTKYKPAGEYADESDIAEVADLIQPNCTAGMLVIEQLWAKPLKQAILNANGVLLAEGRIHPEAASEIEGGK